ncbi:MAG: hypothetical protein J7M14_02200 [Planctomycetes bacterium]|nr:hypothetical protein [Planctomycetota bacterium]
MSIRVLTLASVIVALAAASQATEYTVGPTQGLKSIVNRLTPGDTVRLMPGTYREVMKIQCNGTAAEPITILGLGNVVFDGAGLNVDGVGANPRAVLQIEGANIIIDNIEIKNASNNHNGSGIRMVYSSNTIIRNVNINNCDMGIMGGNDDYTLIENSDIGFNGTVHYNGYSHNMYMSGAGTVEVRGCYIHDAPYGQNFKSRAHYNELWYSWISDSNEGEIGPVDGGTDTSVPNSNFLMVGNTVISKDDRTGNHGKYVLFGEDMGGAHNGTMYMYNNTCIAGDSRNDFVAVFDRTGGADAVVRNNIFMGSDEIVSYWSSPYHPVIDGSNNWTEVSAAPPANWTDNIRGLAPGFVDTSSDDYRLAESSPCVDAATEPLTYVDGRGVTRTVTVDSSYILGRGVVPRLGPGAMDVGAYEYIAPGDTDGDGDVDATDLATLGLNWHPSGTQLTWMEADFDFDGDVDASDLAVIGINWDPTGAAVPEPTSLVMILLATACGPLRRRR